MREIKRYGHGYNKNMPDRIDSMDIYAGTWCKSDDVEVLEKENEELKQEVEKLKGFVDITFYYNS